MVSNGSKLSRGKGVEKIAYRVVHIWQTNKGNILYIIYVYISTREITLSQ